MLRLTPGRDFRLIWIAGTTSQLGDWSSRLALALLVLERGSGATTVGVIGMLFVVPWLGIGQVLTAWSARAPRRTVLIGCDTLRGVAFIVIGFAAPTTPVLLAIVALAALADPVFEATKSAFVSEIVTRDDYSEAIQVTHAANQAASLVGYALGGVVVGLVGAEFALAMNGFTFLISSALILLVSQAGRGDSLEESRPSLAAGLEFLRGDRISAISFATTIIAVTTAMSVESQVTVYGKVVSALGDEAIGVLSAMTPATTLIVVSMLRTGADDTVLLKQGLAISAVSAAAAATLMFAGVGDVLVFLAFALVGVIFAFVTVTNVVVGRRLPDENRVAIFSILQTGVFLGLSVGTLTGGIVSEATTPEIAAGSALTIAAVSLMAPIAWIRPE